MSKDSINYQGIGTRGQSLVVYFEDGQAGTKRFREVVIPFKHLNHDEVWHGMHHAAARRLQEIWEQGGGDPPLDSL